MRYETRKKFPRSSADAPGDLRRWAAAGGSQPAANPSLSAPTMPTPPRESVNMQLMLIVMIIAIFWMRVNGQFGGFFPENNFMKTVVIE
ncbi:MAG TPA: hypothetical protein VI776_04065, partial [Anaerolineales bacterium]|nr:hypothetical protein [Anaerolineales bacterium]